jgi:hypothetical protein
MQKNTIYEMKYIKLFEDNNLKYEVGDYILLKDDPKYQWTGIDLRCRIYKKSALNYYLNTYLLEPSKWDYKDIFSEYDLSFHGEEVIDRKLTPEEVEEYLKDIEIYNEKRELFIATKKYNL